MDVHLHKNGINRYWSIPIYIYIVSLSWGPENAQRPYIYTFKTNYISMYIVDMYVYVIYTNHALTNQGTKWIKHGYFEPLTTPGMHFFSPRTTLRAGRDHRVSFGQLQQISKVSKLVALVPTGNMDTHSSAPLRIPRWSQKKYWKMMEKIPSGNLLHSYWKYHIYNWFTYSKGWFSIAMLVYQSVWGV